MVRKKLIYMSNGVPVGVPIGMPIGVPIGIAYRLYAPIGYIFVVF